MLMRCWSLRLRRPTAGLPISPMTMPCASCSNATAATEQTHSVGRYTRNRCPAVAPRRVRSGGESSPRSPARLNGTIPSCRRSDAVSGCARGYYRPREVASQHGHPPRQPGDLVVVQREELGRVQNVDDPRPRRFFIGVAHAFSPHQTRPVVPPSDADPRHDSADAVPSSHHEHPPAGRGHAAAEPVARLRRQDNAAATQLRQDDLTQEPEVVALQHARAKLPHDARWQRHVRESHCRQIWLRRRFNDRRVADDSKGCASYRAFFVHRMHDLDLRLDCSPPIEASGRCSRQPPPLAGRVGESRCGIQEGDCCVGDARSCAPSCAELPGTET